MTVQHKATAERSLANVLTLVVVDVDDVKYVINYDYPNSSEDYIHRIGRTGRSDQTGTAYTFFTPNNSKQARDLVNVLQEAQQEVDPELNKLAQRGGGGGGNWRGEFTKETCCSRPNFRS